MGAAVALATEQSVLSESASLEEVEHASGQ